MRISCTLSRLANGHWRASHSGSSLGDVAVTAATRELVLGKLRNELQYRMELCPCSGAWGDQPELEVHEEPSN